YLRLGRPGLRPALLLCSPGRPVRVLAESAPRRLFLRCLCQGAGRPTIPADLQLFSGHGAGDDRDRGAAGRTDRLLGTAENALGPPLCRIPDAPAACHSRDRHRLRLYPALQYLELATP